MKAVSYKKILHEKLDDPEQAAEYLTACYEEGPEVFLLGLRDVVEAQGGVARAAELSKLNRENLYRLRFAQWQSAFDEFEFRVVRARS